MQPIGDIWIADKAMPGPDPREHPIDRMKTSSWPGIALALSAAILWGTTGTSQHFAGTGLSSYWIGALRLAIAAVFFAVLVAATERGRPAGRAPPGLWRRQLLAGVAIAVYNLAFFTGVRLAGVAVGTTIAIGSGPLFAGALQALITRRPPVGLWWLCLTIHGNGSVTGWINFPGAGQKSNSRGLPGRIPCWAE